MAVGLKDYYLVATSFLQALFYHSGGINNILGKSRVGADGWNFKEVDKFGEKAFFVLGKVAFNVLHGFFIDLKVKITKRTFGGRIIYKIEFLLYICIPFAILVNGMMMQA
jgi:hypothetical protein